MPRRLISLLLGLSVVGAGVIFMTFAGATTEGYKLTADVEQAPSLYENGRVMVRGVRVGTIIEVEPQDEGVRLTLQIDDGVKLPADAHLAVVPITLIADRYVQIEPPFDGGSALEAGAHIPLDRTTIPAELDDVLAQLRGLLSALEPRDGQRGPLAALVENLNEAVAGHEDDISGTLGGGAEVLGNLAASETQITNLIENLDRVFLKLADRSSEIGLINERLNLVVQALSSDRAHLEGTIENIAFLSQEASGLISESGDELGESFGRLENVLRAVLRHEESLAEGMQWTNVIAQGLGATDSSGRGLFAYTGRQAAPGSAGAAYNYRIDARDSIACERIGLLAERLQVLNPDWGFVEVREAVMSYLPETYHDDLGFLIDILVPACADLPSEPSLAARADTAIERALEALGPRRAARLVESTLSGMGDGR